MSKITNSEAYNYVIRREKFNTGNKTIFGEWRGDNYIVYSYGYHFPMYVYDGQSQEWYGNSDKYSRTTTTHQTKCRPPNVSQWFNTEDLKRISNYGIAGIVQQRMEEAIRT